MRPLVSLGLCLLLTACATPYQPNGGLFNFAAAGGYDDRQVNDVVWNIVYWGTAETTRDTMRDYWMYHAAELTLDKGYEGFEVHNLMFFGGSGSMSQNIQIAAVTFIPIPDVGGVQTGPTKKFDGEIKLLRSPADWSLPNVFKAADIKQILAPYITGPKCDNGNICPHQRDYLKSVN